MRSRASIFSAIAVALAASGYELGMGSVSQESLMQQIDMTRLQRSFASAMGSGRGPRPRRPGGTHGSSQHIAHRGGNSGYRPHQGKQECARRVRQIRAGQLSLDQLAKTKANCVVPYC